MKFYAGLIQQAELYSNFKEGFLNPHEAESCIQNVFYEV